MPANALLHWISDLLWPLTCLGCGTRGTRVCTSCLWDLPSPARIEYRPFPGVGRLAAGGTMRTPLLERAIWHLKYRNAIDLAAPLGDWLVRMTLGAGLSLGPDDVIIPIPLHPARVRERGYNQAELLAHRIALGTGTDCMPELLVRERNTPSQVKTASRAERRSNMRGAFDVRHPERVEGRDVFCIDDVCTTGATLQAAATALKAAGARTVTGIVLAR